MSESLPLQIKVHPAIADIPKAAWNALVAQDPHAVPFMDWRWLHALEASGCISEQTGWKARHFALWRGNHLVAAAPGFIKNDSHGEFVFDWSWATAAERLGIRYYPKLILAAPLTPATGSRVLVAPGEDRGARLRELVRGAVDFCRSEGLSSLHVLFPTTEEARTLHSMGFGIRHGVQYHWRNAAYGSFDEFLGRFTSKRRNQIRRELRALDSGGITFLHLAGPAVQEADPDLVFRLYRSTVDKHIWGRQYLNQEFFRQVLATFSDHVELVHARRGQQVVAGTFNLAAPDVLYGRYWGCLEEVPFLHFGACLYEPVRRAIERGLARFEPGAGGEHKLVRGFEPTLTYSAHWIFNRTLDRAVRDFLAHERNAVAKGMPEWRRETGLKERGDGADEA